MNIEIQKYPDINYSLVFRPDGYEKYVCAYAPEYDEDGNILNWGQGHYFYSIDDAIDYMRDLVRKNIRDGVELEFNEEILNSSLPIKKNLDDLDRVIDILSYQSPYDDHFNPYNSLANEFDRFAEAYNYAIDLLRIINNKKTKSVDFSDENNSVYNAYKNLSKFQKDNLRLFSCYSAANDELSEDIHDRDNLINQIGDLAYFNWLKDYRDGLSCEDLATLLANGFNNHDIDITKLKLLNHSEFVDMVDSQNFEDVLKSPTFIKRFDYDKVHWDKLIEQGSYEYHLLISSKSYDPEGISSDFVSQNILCAGPYDDVKKVFDKIANDPDKNVKITRLSDAKVEVYYINDISKDIYEIKEALNMSPKDNLNDDMEVSI